MKTTNIFNIIPDNFFNPLSSKNKRDYWNCIFIIFTEYQYELTYGIDRDDAAKLLINYFDNEDSDIIVDEETGVLQKHPREKANAMIRNLKHFGWFEEEPMRDHKTNIVLRSYAVPIIEAMIKAEQKEEIEYQGLISATYAILHNKELYVKPYELIVKSIQDNTERLESELKRLSVSIKGYIDQQTKDLDAAESLDLLFEYFDDIGSQAYLRMKTSDNKSFFRNSIIEKIDEIIETESIMQRTVKSYMTIEKESDENVAYDTIITILHNVKNTYYKLDAIVNEIDRRHAQCIQNAVMRAKFKLSTGVDMKGKLYRLMDIITQAINDDIVDSASIFETIELCSVYSQKHISPESLWTIPVRKGKAVVDELPEKIALSDEKRELYKEALREENKRRFSVKNINNYVMDILKEETQISVRDLCVETKRDVIRLIYIVLYSNDKKVDYFIKHKDGRIKNKYFEYPEFDIIRK